MVMRRKPQKPKMVGLPGLFDCPYKVAREHPELTVLDRYSNPIPSNNKNYWGEINIWITKFMMLIAALLNMAYFVIIFVGRLGFLGEYHA